MDDMTRTAKIIIGIAALTTVAVVGAMVLASNARARATDKIVPPPYPTQVMTPAARRVWDHVLSQPQFAHMGHMGVFSCRAIAGSSISSQHAWGNAIDFKGTAAEMQLLADYLVKHAAELGINYVIYNRMVSQAGGPWRPYTGVSPHTDHVHIDFFPVQYGTPACKAA